MHPKWHTRYGEIRLNHSSLNPTNHRLNINHSQCLINFHYIRRLYNGVAMSAALRIHNANATESESIQPLWKSLPNIIYALG